MLSFLTKFLINKFVYQGNLGIVLNWLFKAYMDKIISENITVKQAEKVFIWTVASVLNTHRLTIGFGNFITEEDINQLMKEDLK